MFYDLIIASRVETDFSKREALTVQIVKTPLEHPQIICGRILESAASFCRAHDTKCCNDPLTVTPCSTCLFKCFSLSDFSDRQLVFKYASISSDLKDGAEKICTEAELQHRLHCSFPDNVPSCVGNYTTHCYYIRRRGSSNAWRAVKICLYVAQYSLKRSTVVSRQSSQQQNSQQLLDDSVPLPSVNVLETNNQLEEIVSQIRCGLAEISIVWDRKFLIDYRDDDFFKKHNIIYSTSPTMINQEEEEEEEVEIREPRFVFIDFGNNISVAPNVYHRASFI